MEGSLRQRYYATFIAINPGLNQKTIIRKQYGYAQSENLTQSQSENLTHKL